MAKKSREKSHIEKQQERIEELKETDDLRKRYLRKEDIEKIEAQELKETKKRIWGEEEAEAEAEAEAEEAEEAEEKAEKITEKELDTEEEKKKIMEEIEKDEVAEEKDEEEIRKERISDQQTLKQAFEKIEKERKQRLSPENLTTKKINGMLEQGLISGENLSDISQMQMRAKRNEICEKDFIYEIEKIIEENKETSAFTEASPSASSEATEDKTTDKVEKKLKNLEEQELMQDLLFALEKPIESLIYNNSNIKKCDEKIENLKKGLIKPLLTWQRRKDIEQAKEVAIEEKEKAKETIADIENKYILKGFSAKEIREIIIKKVKEAKEMEAKPSVADKEEHLDTTEAKENFNTTEQKGNLDIALSEKEKKRLNKDKIKRGAIKAGKGVKTGAGILGVIALTITGAWLNFSSGVVEWAKKNNIKMP
jgi:hypothetical protein